ncbi:hypothetical protein PINS_up012883 [Pythium insidiosum]|nr:hypothetical protein PINS_up012883 [Pythium insidiosum]
MPSWRSSIRAAALAVAAAVLSSSGVHAGGSQPLCSIPPGTYAQAKIQHPEAAFALAELEKHAIATWYSDREINGDYVATAKQIVAQCPTSSRLNLVVYGLPNKDCEAKESMVGSRNQNSQQYAQFVSTLKDIVGDRHALYILEPDAVGLLAHGGCAKQFGYGENLAIAIRTLSQNPNADIFLDVGYWMLGSEKDLASVTAVVRELLNAGRVKGIAINTSNYRSNQELSALCAKFRGAIGRDDLRCVVDTSRNYKGSSGKDEWCNYRDAAIGRVPTGNTGDPNIDYFIWIKPPGESDGTCTSGRTSDALTGPEAGAFFPQYFKSLWNEGSLVKELKMPMIDGTIRDVKPNNPEPAPTPAPAPAPTVAPTAAPTPAPDLCPDRCSDHCSDHCSFGGTRPDTDLRQHLRLGAYHSRVDTDVCP